MLFRDQKETLTMARLLTVFLLLMRFASLATTSVCPYGWRDYPASLSCYLITGYHVRYTFDKAVDKCVAHQAYLVAIGDQKEMSWLAREIQQFSAAGLPPKMAWWIGLDDKGQGQGVKYLNGSHVNLSLIPWAGQDPPAPSTTRRCASVVNGTVYLSNCSSWLGLVCERSKTLPMSCDVENGWVYINGSCFKYYPGKQSWYLAQSTCRQLEADLAKISTQEEVNFIWDKIRMSSSISWLGLKSDIVSKTYKWSDGSDVDGSLSWWAALQPHSLAYMLYTDPDLCGFISANNTRMLSSWMTDDCNERHSFTCSKPQGVCADGWISHMSICIKFYPQYLVTWRKARQFCQAMGGDLIIIPMKSYQDLVNMYLEELRDAGINSFWLGLQDMTNNTYQWVDHMYTMSWTNWVPGSPGNKSGSLQMAYISTGDKTGRWQLTSDLTTRKAIACFISGTKKVKEVSTQFSDIQCPDQWEVAGDTCVYLSNQNATWSQASNNCEEHQAQLIVVNSLEAQHFLNSRAISGQFWIGLNDRTSDGEFTWVNGSQLVVTYWASGQPDHSEDENCVVVKAYPEGVRWLDTICREMNSYICQRMPLNKPGPSPSPPAGNAAPFSARCGSMWEERPGTNSCYQFRDTTLSWSDAQELCSSFNGSLVSIVSREEQSYIEGRLKAVDSVDVWIGASDRRREAGWEWEDGAPFAYLNWHSSEPNDQSLEHCAAINTHTMRWFDYQCSLRIGFICKKAAEDGLTTTTPAMTVPINLPAGQYYGCPIGWLVYDNNCYLMKRMPATWTEAQTACRQEGGTLASISSDLENKFVWSQLPKEACQNAHSNDSQCQIWADAKECQKNPSWMSLNCQLSCSLCTQSCSDRHTHYECRFWASIGECLKNPDWMWSNCALSCGCDTSINEGYWLGLNDRYSQMTFVWDDLSAMTFTNWLPNEPNNYQSKHEDCVKIHSADGAWSDELCDQKNAGYVCKRKMVVMDTPTISPDKVGCPISGFGYGSTCFVVVDTPRTWSDARSFCSKQNASLATILDSITSAFMTSELVHKTSSYWIGLSSTAGTYSWDRGDLIQYLVWAPSHTGNENNTCVAVRSQKPVGLWEDVQCQTLLPFICQTFGRGLVKTTTMTVSPQKTQAQCPPSWESHGDHCYKMYFVSKNWFEAEADCECYGGSLASIHDDVINTFITNLAGWNLAGGFWIGLTDHLTESSYQWSDQAPFEFSKWDKGEPNSATTAEDCVEVLAPSMKWNDINCYLSRAYVCSIVKGFPVPSDIPTAPTTPASQCQEEGWLFHAGFCYYVSPSYGRNSSLSWFMSRWRCQSLGADLVSITSQDENNFLTTELSRRETSLFWIGLNQLEQSSYVWSDGSPVSFDAWGPNEPNDFMGGERCVSVDGNRGFWQDDECGTELGYVCKKGNNSESTVPLVTSPVNKGVCPDGFLSAGASNKCYYIGGRGNSSSADPKRGWEDSRDFCRNLSSQRMVDIGSIHNIIDQDLVTSLMWDLDSDLWLGLSDRLLANQYRWQDNSPVSYTNWATGQPVRHFYWGLNKDNCVEMLRRPYTAADTARWNDGSCNKENAFLCQTIKSPSQAPSQASLLPSSTMEPIDMPACPVGFFSYKSACYYVINQPQTWSEAREACRSFNADLASTSDIFEISRLDLALLDSRVSGQAWIGLKFDQVSLEYMWSDGWSVELTFWSSADPDIQTNDSCVALIKASWNDTSCGEALPAICEIKSEARPTPSPSSSGQCADPLQISFGEFCYRAEPNDRVSWPEASYKCAQLGMEVASVHSEAENNFVKGYVDLVSVPTTDLWLHNPDIWLGLHRDLEGSFRWSDRSPVIYFNWEVGQPSSVSLAQAEDCVKLSRETGRWSDVSCLSRHLGYVCKTRKTLANTLPPSIAALAVTSPGVVSTPVDDLLATGREASYPSPDTSDPSPHYMTPIQSPLTTNDIPLSGGKWAGIMIGFLGMCVIIVGVVFIVKNRNNPKVIGSSPNKPGYDNVLYKQQQDDQSGEVIEVVTIGSDQGQGNVQVEGQCAAHEIGQ